MQNLQHFRKYLQVQSQSMTEYQQRNCSCKYLNRKYGHKSHAFASAVTFLLITFILTIGECRPNSFPQTQVQQFHLPSANSNWNFSSPSFQVNLNPIQMNIPENNSSAGNEIRINNTNNLSRKSILTYNAHLETNATNPESDTLSSSSQKKDPHHIYQDFERLNLDPTETEFSILTFQNAAINLNKLISTSNTDSNIDLGTAADGTGISTDLSMTNISLEERNMNLTTDHQHKLHVFKFMSGSRSKNKYQQHQYKQIENQNNSQDQDKSTINKEAGKNEKKNIWVQYQNLGIATPIPAKTLNYIAKNNSFTFNHSKGNEDKNETSKATILVNTNSSYPASILVPVANPAAPVSNIRTTEKFTNTDSVPTRHKKNGKRIHTVNKPNDLIQDSSLSSEKQTTTFSIEGKETPLLSTPYHGMVIKQDNQILDTETNNEKSNLFSSHSQPFTSTSTSLSFVSTSTVTSTSSYVGSSLYPRQTTSDLEANKPESESESESETKNKDETKESSTATSMLTNREENENKDKLASSNVTSKWTNNQDFAPAVIANNKKRTQYLPSAILIENTGREIEEEKNISKINEPFYSHNEELVRENDESLKTSVEKTSLDSEDSGTDEANNIRLKFNQLPSRNDSAKKTYLQSKAPDAEINLMHTENANERIAVTAQSTWDSEEDEGFENDKTPAVSQKIATVVDAVGGTTAPLTLSTGQYSTVEAALPPTQEIKFQSSPFLISPPFVPNGKPFLGEKVAPLSLLDELGPIL